MRWDVAEFCQNYADAYAAGDFESLADRHSVPLVVYTPDKVSLRMTRVDIMAALRGRHAIATAAGMTAIRATVLVIDSVKEGRLPLMIEWSFLGTGGEVIARSRMRHYCRRRPDGSMFVEMVEILSYAFSDMRE